MDSLTDGRMPAFFIGHGNPMNAIERNKFHLYWEELGRRLPKPKAILCISAHWETRGVYITASKKPETIHDFYGFPKALFDVQYPVQGDLQLARRVAELLANFNARLDSDRGLDHGVWSVLVAMYPAANIPVVQLSLDTSQPGSFHYNIARELATLRDEGVLILCSGNIVHNLGMFNFHNPEPFDWAIDCDEEIKRQIIAHEHGTLICYNTDSSNAMLAIPTPEHYFPLLYALALQDEREPLSFFNSEVLSSISMTSVQIGVID